MEKEVPKKILLLREAVTLLDIFLAILIILTAQQVAQTNLGRSGLVFGFVMLWITIVLRISHRL